MSINLNRLFRFTVNAKTAICNNYQACSPGPIPECTIYDMILFNLTDRHSLPSDFIFGQLKKCLTWRSVKMPLIDRIG